MTDDDPLVYVATHRCDHRRVYHTDPDCRHLQRANNPARKRLSVIPHRTECRQCAGVSPPGVSRERSYAHYRSLQAAAEGGES